LDRVRVEVAVTPIDRELMVVVPVAPRSRVGWLAVLTSMVTVSPDWG
jgi:hypothetical protein